MKILIIQTSITFKELCKELKLILDERGIFVRNIDKSDYNKIYKKEFDVFIVVGMYAFNPGIDHKGKVFVGWHTEWYPEFYTGDRLTNLYCHRKFLKVVNGYDLIITPTRDQHEYLKSKGYPSLFITMGYISEFDYGVNYNNQKYDIFFYGQLKSRRKRLIDILAKHYSFYPKMENIYGREEKNLAFSNSKICLDLNSGETFAFNWLRFGEISANKMPIVADFSYDTFPYRSNEDYLLIDEYNMVSKIDNFLNNESLMNQFANNAFEKSCQYSLKENIDTLLNFIYHLRYNSTKKLYRVIRLLNATKVVKLDYENVFPFLPF